MAEITWKDGPTPTAWSTGTNLRWHSERFLVSDVPNNWKPLYERKPWVSLTSDDIHDAFCHAEYDANQDWNDDPEGWCKAFASYVEAKLKEKNNE
jgi:hypothetical protein